MWNRFWDGSPASGRRTSSQAMWTWRLRQKRSGQAVRSPASTLIPLGTECVGRAVIDFSPAEGMSSSYREVSRDRVLTDQELAAGQFRSPPNAGAVRGDRGILGANRSEAGEVAQLRWDELLAANLRGIIAPGILGSTVMRRAKKRKNLSSARHYDQIRFRFHMTKTQSCRPGMSAIPDVIDPSQTWSNRIWLSEGKRTWC